MSFTLYSCHHDAPAFHAIGSAFVPLWTGGSTDEDRRWLSDQVGPSLRGQPCYSEMRQQYFVWARGKTSDYVGFEHYRRLFFLSPASSDELSRDFPALLPIRRAVVTNQMAWQIQVGLDLFGDYVLHRQRMSDEAMSKLDAWIGRHDIILPRAFREAPLEQQFLTWHRPDLWEHFVVAIGEATGGRCRLEHFNLGQIGTYFCNMHIMRWDLFDEYMAFWWDVMQRMHAHLDFSQRDAGFLSERLLTLWVTNKMVADPSLVVGEVPFLQCPTSVPAMTAHLNAHGVTPSVEALSA